MTQTLFGVVMVVLLHVVLVNCYHTDCRRNYTSGFELCSSGIACRSPYECCDNGRACCYEGPKHELYSVAEVVGLVLCSTSIATSLILALVICGATYCSSREDKSHIFGN